MDDLTHWPWPGNIRELENFIERAVILTTGPVLDVASSPLRAPHANGTATHGSPRPAPASQPPASQTLREAEREHILRAHDAQGIVGGPHGAASRLGLKRTTLQARMRKLGITRQFQ